MNNSYDFLDKLVSFDNKTVENLLNNDEEKQKLLSINPMDWLSWLDEKDGRLKFSNLVSVGYSTGFSRSSIIDRVNEIGEIIRKLSKQHIDVVLNNQNNKWITKNIMSNYKTILSDILTLPYPCYTSILSREIEKSTESNQWKFEFRTVFLPIMNEDKTVDEDLIEHLSKMMNDMLFDDENSTSSVLQKPQLKCILEHMFTRFINISGYKKYYVNHFELLMIRLLDPKYNKSNNSIQGLGIVLNMMLQSINFENMEFDTIKIFCKSLNNYINHVNSDSNFNSNSKIINLNHELFYKFETQFFQHSASLYHSTEDEKFQRVNDMFQSNPLFFNTLLSNIAQPNNVKNNKIVYNIENWTRINKYFKKQSGKLLTTFKYVAKFLYERDMKHFADILRSDFYIKNLSQKDKEILALWTHTDRPFKHNQEKDIFLNETSDFFIHKQQISNWLKNRLNQIIIQAPACKSQHVFMRGISKRCENLDMLSINPLAMTYDKNVARRFSMPNSKQGSCVLYIDIPKNSQFLALDRVSVFNGSEKEILFKSKSKMSPITTITTTTTTVNTLLDKTKDSIDVHILKNKNEIENNGNDDYDGDDYDKGDEIKDSINVHLIKDETEIGENGNNDNVKGDEKEPGYITRPMNREELIDIITKSTLKKCHVPFEFDDESIMQAVLSCLKVGGGSFQVLLNRAKSLLLHIRAWQLINCGFGNIADAVAEFWKSIETHFGSYDHNFEFKLWKNQSISSMKETNTLSDEADEEYCETMDDLYNFSTSIEKESFLSSKIDVDNNSTLSKREREGENQTSIEQAITKRYKKSNDF